jgi:nitroreductase
LKARFDEGEFCYGFTYNAGTLKRAPQVMVMAYKKGISGHEKDGSNATPKGDDFWEAFDCGIAAQTFCLLAHERGIGTVIQGYFDDAMIAEALNIPEGFSIGAVIPMGYIDEESKTPVRKEAGELITFI